MIHIPPSPKSSSVWILWAVFGSFALHGVLFAAGTQYADGKEPQHYESGKIEFTAAPPPPEPEPEPALTEAEPPKPEEQPLPKRAPKPNSKKSAPSPQTPPKPVFGATADSVGNANSGVAIRIGNTLEAEMTNEAPPKKVQPLAEPEVTNSAAQVTAKERIAPVPVYQLSKAPTFKSKAEPSYPESAREAELEGVVVLEVLIDKNGRVVQVKVLKTPGGGLEGAAISAVRRSLFEPGIAGGKAVPVKIKIPYRFVLDS
ncbi:MAG: energy transducer TonB [Deltaproteobacteria bacterium]|nr:energy transducer TonB [Deltaproteobacteria bacterium]MBN2670710.1 energy transducer TonB [Deltaproteobacteria bacterium]